MWLDGVAVKPKIRRAQYHRRGQWVCIGASFPLYAMGYGATPALAYEDYIAKLQAME